MTAPDARAPVARLLSVELLALLENYITEIATEVIREQAAHAAAARPSWYPVEEAARRLGISAAAVRMRARRGGLETRRQGRRIYVSARSVDELDTPGNGW